MINPMSRATGGFRSFRIWSKGGSFGNFIRWDNGVFCFLTLFCINFSSGCVSLSSSLSCISVTIEKNVNDGKEDENGQTSCLKREPCFRTTMTELACSARAKSKAQRLWSRKRRPTTQYRIMDDPSSFAYSRSRAVPRLMFALLLA